MKYDYDKLESLLGKCFLFRNEETGEEVSDELAGFSVRADGVWYFARETASWFNAVYETVKVNVSPSEEETFPKIGKCVICYEETDNFEADPYAEDIKKDGTKVFICKRCVEFRRQEI